MNKHPTVVASVIFALLMVMIALPLLVGGIGSTLFNVLFWALLISFAGALAFAFLNRHEHL